MKKEKKPTPDELLDKGLITKKYHALLVKEKKPGKQPTYKEGVPLKVLNNRKIPAAVYDKVLAEIDRITKPYKN